MEKSKKGLEKVMESRQWNFIRSKEYEPCFSTYSGGYKRKQLANMVVYTRITVRFYQVLFLSLLQKNSKILILNQEGDWWRGECDGQVGGCTKY